MSSIAMASQTLKRTDTCPRTSWIRSCTAWSPGSLSMRRQVESVEYTHQYDFLMRDCNLESSLARIKNVSRAWYLLISLHQLHCLAFNGILLADDVGKDWRKWPVIELGCRYTNIEMASSFILEFQYNVVFLCSLLVLWPLGCR
jgi:hypothetical protein